MLLRTLLYFDNSISTTPIHATSQIYRHSRTCKKNPTSRKFPTCVTPYEVEGCMCVSICQRTMTQTYIYIFRLQNADNEQVTFLIWL